MNVNYLKTKEFYENYNDVCDCAACRNYTKMASARYPHLNNYLSKKGIDMSKPFETMWTESHEDETIIYFIVQYVVIGKWEKSLPVKLKGLTISKAKAHPGVNINESFFVLDIEGICLPWGLEERTFQKRISKVRLY